MGTKAKTFNLLPRQAHPRAKDTYRLKGRGWEKIFHANGQDRRSGVALLISNKIAFKTKAIEKGKEGHQFTVKGSIQEEDTTHLYLEPNIRHK